MDDREPVDPADTFCDYCLKQIFMAPLRPITMSGTTSWQCPACYARTQQRYADAMAPYVEAADAEWQALRDRGFSEPEMRAMSGDR